MRITRRSFTALGAGAAFGADPIDRRALVSRHNPVLTRLDPRSPLSVGNGEFAYTADVTGLQTFPEPYERGTPLCTQSQWGWHSFPAPSNPDLRLTVFDTRGREVGYPVSAAGQEETYRWLRENPHRLHLGRIGFALPGRDLEAVRQELDLWTGVLKSRFTVNGAAYDVETCCHPSADAVAARVRGGEIAIVFEFPYGSPAVNAADWTRAGAHRSEISARSPNAAAILRELDSDRYTAAISWQGDAVFKREGPHRFTLSARGAELRFVCAFSPGQAALPAGDVFAASAGHWRRFWTLGGAVDFSAASDPRAREIERRAVLSQYLTAIQCSGSIPPQETGLTCNSWYGKFHLEMHWWHAAHFAQWNRIHLLERSLAWYAKILPSARRTARQQGYRGARWPKMAGPEGRDSPSPIGPLLIWQQPHIIWFAEQMRRARPGGRTLDRYRDLVFESAEFMASFAALDGGRYVLGPPLIPAQENHPPRETWNPTFELEYWDWGLGVAQQWRGLLGMPPHAGWERVRSGLAPLPVHEGVYLAHENCPQTYSERNRDHPSMLAALGVLPGVKADRETMRRTLHKVLAEWRWPDTWGWDYPMVAMTAARLGEPELAVNALLLDSPKNEWLANGHNYQRPELPLYLPGNGGLLAAVAMMAAGWEGGPRGNAPGFPAAWKVRREGLGSGSL